MASYVGTLIVGALIGSLITYRVTLARERDREREKRKSDFRSFIVRFRSEAIDLHYPTTSHFANSYQEKKPALRELAATVRNDFPLRRSVEFDGLVSIAAGFTDDQACEPDGKRRVIGALDAILQFLDGPAT